MKSNSLWNYRKSRNVNPRDKFILGILIIAGIISCIKFADWWFRSEHVGTMALYIILSLSIWYGILRYILIWINYFGIKNPEKIKAPTGKKVAIFTTSSPGEPLSMFDKTLEACKKITYPHTTYLLDDTQDHRFKEVAIKHGAVWLELVNLPGAKAGKVNKAIELTNEEFILIMDPDHIPFPNFLDEVLGFFEDEKIGFVQVCQAYYNQYRSFTAKGAAEQTYTFYGPTQMSLFGRGSAVAIGANCTFRRKALESINGHGVGLAEDLITAIRIHAAGWKSIYHPVVVSRGLVPEDFGSFCKQQLKWARGVHEVLFTECPRLFRKLTNWQRLTYLSIGTYYLTGLLSFIYILIPFIYFWTGITPAKMKFTEFIINGAPIVIIGLLIYIFVQKWLCHPKHEAGLHLRGMVLKFACWPVYLLGFILSVVNTEIPYIPTAKKAVTGFITPFIRPLVLQCVLFVITISYVLIYRWKFIPAEELALSSEMTWGMIAFSSLSTLLVLGGIFAAIESSKIKVEEPWQKINVDLIEKNKE
jgi:cellulose synthase (UDP-forming)